MAAGGKETEDNMSFDAAIALGEQADDLAAIQAGIADMEAGRTKSLADVDAELRKMLGFKR
jgi:predicted transcriptional regulator